MNKLFVLFLFLIPSLGISQASMSLWEVNAGEGVIDLPATMDMRGQHGNPIVYPLQNRPGLNDAGWKLAPVKNGVVNFVGFDDAAGTTLATVGDAHSHITKNMKQVDFTYFRTFIDIPEGTKVDKFTVKVGNVDDGARMYIYNSMNPKGHHNPEKDGKLAGANYEVDFTKNVVVGELNTIIIVQFDDAAAHNKMVGELNVELNGKAIVPGPVDETKPKGTTYAEKKINLIYPSKWQVKNSKEIIDVDKNGSLLVYTGDDDYVNYGPQDDYLIGEGQITKKGFGAVVTGGNKPSKVLEANKNYMAMEDTDAAGNKEVTYMGRVRKLKYHNLIDTEWKLHDMILLSFNRNQTCHIELESKGELVEGAYTIVEKDSYTDVNGLDQKLKYRIVTMTFSNLSTAAKDEGIESEMKFFVYSLSYFNMGIIPVEGESLPNFGDKILLELIED